MPFAQYNKKSSGTSSSKWGSSPSTQKTEKAPASKWARIDPVETEDPFDTTSVQRSIENAQTRIVDAGGKVNQDKRNRVEKMLNLPEGQNALFDVLDVIGRPQQALYGGAKALLEGTSRDEGAMRGLTGKQRISGSYFMDKAGIKNKYAKAGTGLALDIASDPLNAIGGGLVKGIARGVGLVKRAAGGTIKTAEKVVPGLKTLRETKIEPAVEAGKDALGRIFKYQYKWDETLKGGKSDVLKDKFNQTNTAIANMSEDSLINVSDSARRAGGIDTGSKVGRILEKPLRQFEDVKMYELPDGAKRTTSKRELKNEVIGNQQRVKELGKVVRENRRGIDTKISQSVSQLDKLDRDIHRMFNSAENKKLKTLQKTDPKSLVKPRVLKGFAPKSPVLNVLMKRGDEIKSQIDEVRSELGLPKVRKKSYTPEQMQGLATQRAFKQLSPSPAFNVLLKHRNEAKDSLEELRGLRKTAGQDEIKEIQKLDDYNSAIKESAKNPVMVQREIARPQRKISTDPKIQNAAKDLIKSNNVVRQWAVDNGIPVGEIEGYMRHVFSAEEKALRKQKKLPIDRNGGMNNPDKKILNERTLHGSAEDVNERIGRNFFETNAFFSSAQGQRKLIEYGNAVKFRRDILSNPDFARPLKKGDIVPAGAEAINTNNYKFLKDPNGVLVDDVGGDYIVTKGVREAMDRYQHLTTDEGTRALLKAFDTVQRGWKKLTLLSPWYHARNIAGGNFNNYIAGMNPVDIAKHGSEAVGDVYNAVFKNKRSPLFKEYRDQGLANSNLSRVEFGGLDFEDSFRKMIKERSKNTAGKVATRLNPLRLPETSREFGEIVDQANRLSLYSWSRSKGMTPKEAAAKVREVQFDYTRTTNAEREGLARVMPFYRWMRFNMPYQLQSLAKDPARYTHADKARRNLQDSMGIDEENTPQFMKEQFAAPVSENKFLSLNLPISDLTKLTNPLKLASDSMTPLIKTPLELASNFNLFKGKKIEEFSGQQKQYQLPGGKTVGLPAKTAYTIEQLGGQVGRGFSQYLQKEGTESQDNKFRTPSMGINSVLKPYDVVKEQYYQKLKELKDLQDQIDVMEQQTGVRPRTVNEIKKN